MVRTAWLAMVLLLVTVVRAAPAADDEIPVGKGMTEANTERLLIDDMEDVSDWYNGSPEETAISASGRNVKEGGHALLFANVVDHTKGEKNYPVGWPRTGKDLKDEAMRDWTGYDRFECWIYAETSRSELPKDPIGVGFYHSGARRSSHFPLAQVAKDDWVKIDIPVAKLLAPEDVRRVQFNISESNYRHGDRVDFYIDQAALVRYVDPAVAEVDLDRKLLYTHDRTFRAGYRLVGYRNLDATSVELSIVPAEGPPVAESRGPAARDGELTLSIDRPLVPGQYAARLALRDAEGRLIDRKAVGFRVIDGQFAAGE